MSWVIVLCLMNYTGDCEPFMAFTTMRECTHHIQNVMLTPRPAAFCNRERITTSF